MSFFWRGFSRCGFFAIFCLVGYGTYRAYFYGAHDFDVFYEAWHLVLQGRGRDIYRVGPDRFLYGPGFAWLLSPLAFIPKKGALALWCLSKTLILGSLIYELSQSWVVEWENKFRFDRWVVWGLSAWGVMIVARPILIDFEYGQVNLWVLVACAWGLMAHFNHQVSTRSLFFRWFLLTFAAFTKLFPLPLLVVPWFVTRGIDPKRLKVERVAVFSSFLFAFAVPFWNQGWTGMWDLLLGWREAVLARGLPLESHNQSFTAFLYHYFSGQPTFVLSEGGQTFTLGWAGLSISQIQLLSMAWALGSCGLILGWIVSGSQYWISKSTSRWIAVLLGLLIVPSHLVWKPYFVLSVPLTIHFIQQTLLGKSKFAFGVLLLLFSMINLTGFDFVGHTWAVYFEAGSLFLMAHLTFMALLRDPA